MLSALEDDEIPEDDSDGKSNNKFHQFAQINANKKVSTTKNSDDGVSKADKIWITMAVCWSANTKFHGKENFPYTKAALLSSQLWMTMTPAKVVMQIVYSEATVTEELQKYKEELEG